jgi:hypothetical protein
MENRTSRFDDTAAIVHEALRHFLDVAHPYGQMGEPQLVHRPPFRGSAMTGLLEMENFELQVIATDHLGLEIEVIIDFQDSFPAAAVKRGSSKNLETQPVAPKP